LKSVPLTRASQLKPFVTTLHRIGVPVERRLEEAKVPLHALQSPNLQIPERPLWVLLDRVSRGEGIPDLGFLIGEQSRIQDIGAFGVMLTQAYTLNDCLRLFVDNIDTHCSDSMFWLQYCDRELHFCRKGTRGIDVGLWPVEQYVVMFMVKLVRLAAGNAWRPPAVYLQARHAPGLSRTKTLSDARVRLGQAYTGIAMPARILSARLNATNEPPATLGAPLSANPAPEDSTLATSLRHALGPYLRDWDVSLDFCAELAGTSTRTLQRRLAEEGVSYSAIVDQARFSRAETLLTGSDARLSDIAHELGYSHPAHFTRAFRRWTGVNPKQYREEHGVD
jgi:AraC-like DNA-binding protein